MSTLVNLLLAMAASILQVSEIHETKNTATRSEFINCNETAYIWNAYHINQNNEQFIQKN